MVAATTAEAREAQIVTEAKEAAADIKPAVTTEENEVLAKYAATLHEDELQFAKGKPGFLRYTFIKQPFAKLQNGQYIPLIGLGTYKSQDIGGAVEAALRAGYRHIDCASHYHNEPLIGEAIGKVLKEGLVKRENMFVTSKLWNDDHEPAKVRAACVRTLRDLRLEYMDLYLIHWPFTDKNTAELDPPYQATWQAMEKLVEEGLVKNIGVSNLSVKKLSDVLKYAKIRPAVNQVEVHPYFRNQEMIDYCAKEGIHVTAYSSLGTPSSAGHLVKKSAPNPAYDPVVRELAKKYERIPQEIIIRWGVQHGTSVLVKSGTPKHIKTNIRNTTNFALEDADYKKMTAIKHQLRLLDGYPWLHPVGPYRTFSELWDDNGETERGRNALIEEVYNFVDIPTVTVADEAEMPLVSFGTGPAVSNQTRWEIKEAIQNGHRHLDVSTTGDFDEVKQGLALCFLEQMVQRDQLFITSTVRDPEAIEDSVRLSLEELNLNYFNLLLLPSDDNCEDLLRRWADMEELYHNNVVEAIGLRDCSLKQLQALMKKTSISPSVISVEVHPYHRNDELVNFCKEQDIFVITHSPSGMETGKSKSEERSKLLTDPVVTSIAYEINKANKQLNQHRLQVLLRWALQRGIAAVCEAAGRDIDRANVNVFTWELSKKDFDALSNLSKN
jgi:diketogulonate reductase-like aldo/keto reductase